MPPQQTTDNRQLTTKCIPFGLVTGHLTGAFSDRNISLEMALRPADEPNNRLPHILSFWDGRPQEVFLVGQWKDSPAIRVRTTDPEISRGYRERGKGKSGFHWVEITQ